MVITITVGDTPPRTPPWTSPAEQAPSLALVTCCALAIAYQRHLTVTDFAHAEQLVADVLETSSEEQVLRWRQRYYEATLDIRWRAARLVLRAYYAELPGALDIPDDHELAGLPPIPSVGITASPAAL